MAVYTHGAHCSDPVWVFYFFLTQPEALLQPFLLPNKVRVAEKGSLAQTCACCFLNTEGQVKRLL